MVSKGRSLGSLNFVDGESKMFWREDRLVKDRQGMKPRGASQLLSKSFQKEGWGYSRQRSLKVERVVHCILLGGDEKEREGGNETG